RSAELVQPSPPGAIALPSVRRPPDQSAAPRRACAGCAPHSAQPRSTISVRSRAATQFRETARSAAPAEGSCCPPGAAGELRPGLLSPPALPWRVSPISTLRDNTQHEATVHERGTAEFPAFTGKPNAALKATVRYFHAMDCRAIRACRHAPQAGNEQHASLDRKLDVLRLDAGQRRDDRQLPLTIEHVDRRLPIHRRRGLKPRLKESAMQLLRPLDHCAGFRPHPASPLG